MINLRMGSSSVNRGIMDDEGIVDSILSSSEVSSVESSESSDLMDEATSSSPPASVTSSASSSSSQLATSPLHDMSSLMLQLPLKRGLSKYFQGKSQSFTSLANVRSLEDLAKPDNPYYKKLKSCRSYGGGLSESHKSTSHLPRITSSSRFISKRAQSSRVSSFSRGSAQRNPSFIGNKPSIPHPPPPIPHRSTSTISFSNQTPLFA